MIRNKVQLQEFTRQMLLLLAVLAVSLLVPLAGVVYAFWDYFPKTEGPVGLSVFFTLLIILPPFLFTLFLCTFFMSVFFWPLLLAVYQGVWTMRHRQLLSLFLASREAQTPLAPMVRDYAENCVSPFYAKKLRRFSDSLERGFTLRESLTKYPGIMRPDLVAMIDAAPNDPKTLQSIEATLEEEQINHTAQPSLFVRLIYLLNVIYAFAMLSAFIFAFIMPRYEEIFDSFETNLPVLTNVVFYLGQIMFPFVVPIVVLSGFFLLGVCFMVLIHSGLMRMRPIGLRRLFRNMDSARMLRIFGAGLRADLPIPKLMEIYNWSVARSDYLSRRGQRIDDRIEQGQPWIQTLWKEKILNADEVPILESAQLVGNLPAALDDLAMSKMRKQYSQIDDCSKVIYFVMLSSLAILVGIFVVSMFLPLVKLIQDLS